MRYDDARHGGAALVSSDGKYRWNGGRWVPTAAPSVASRLVQVQQQAESLPAQPEMPHQGAGFFLPAWMVLILGLCVGLGVLWLFEPEFFLGW